MLLPFLVFSSFVIMMVYLNLLAPWLIAVMGGERCACSAMFLWLLRQTNFEIPHNFK